MLFADAAALAGDPGVAEPARRAARAIAGHLTDLLNRGQASGDIRADIDAETASWLLMSILSAGRLRAAAMPGRDRLEPALVTLALQALAPPAATTTAPSHVETGEADRR